MACRRIVWVSAGCLLLAECQRLPATAAPAIAGYTAGRNAALTQGRGSYEAKLDAELAARDDGAIVRTLEATFSGSDDALRARTLNWLALKQEDGPTDSVFIGEFYALGLAVQAVHSQGDDRSRWAKIAASAYFRTLFIALGEAGQCADPVAADGRFGLAAHNMQPAQVIIAHMSQADREAAARDAFVLVNLTFAIRYPDTWLCSPASGQPAFRPYSSWAASRAPALQAVAKGVFKTTPAPPVFGAKRPDIIPLYGS